MARYFTHNSIHNNDDISGKKYASDISIALHKQRLYTMNHQTSYVRCE